MPLPGNIMKIKRALFTESRKIPPGITNAQVLCTISYRNYNITSQKFFRGKRKMKNGILRRTESFADPCARHASFALFQPQIEIFYISHTVA